MKKNILILISIIIMISSFTFAQFDESTIFPAGYYTYGNYSNGNNSNEYTVLSSVYQNRNGGVTAGYDNLLIDNTKWNYKQQTFLIGGMKNFYPFYFKLNYAFVKGVYSDLSNLFNYSDETNLANIHIIYNTGRTYLGISYTYLKLNGIKSLTSNQFIFTLDWIISPKLTLSVNPGYTKLTDGRSLTSIDARTTYIPARWLKITVGGFLGRRAYYFNPNLLTLLNQEETQTSAYYLRTGFHFIKPFDLIAGYQSIHFENYKIEYWTAGFQFNLGI